MFRSALTIAVSLTGLMPPGAAAQHQPAPPGPPIATTTAAAVIAPLSIPALTQTPPPAPTLQETATPPASPAPATAAAPAPVEPVDAFLPLDFEEHGAPESPFGNLIYEMAGRYAIKATYTPAGGSARTSSRAITLTGKAGAKRASIASRTASAVDGGPVAMPDGAFHGRRPARTFAAR